MYPSHTPQYCVVQYHRRHRLHHHPTFFGRFPPLRTRSDTLHTAFIALPSSSYPLAATPAFLPTHPSFHCMYCRPINRRLRSSHHHPPSHPLILVDCTQLECRAPFLPLSRPPALIKRRHRSLPVVSLSLPPLRRLALLFSCSHHAPLLISSLDSLLSLPHELRERVGRMTTMTAIRPCLRRRRPSARSIPAPLDLFAWLSRHHPLSTIVDATVATATLPHDLHSRSARLRTGSGLGLGFPPAHTYTRHTFRFPLSRVPFPLLTSPSEDVAVAIEVLRP
ncbi:hypothetical protein C8Q77DRAFT_598658 [Trametes polyzona]|nr:hypothetical protein C8Q77DRAFT_598658 [Trametes polyzona]